MRVMQILGYSDRGGAAESVYELSCGLRDEGIDVTVAAPAGDGALPSALMCQGIPWIDVPLSGRYDAVSFGRLRREMKRRNIDVVHTHCRNADLIGGMAASSVGRPVLTHLRGLFRDADGAAVSTWVDQLHRHMLRRVPRRLIAISDAVQRRALEWLGLPPSRIALVKHGVDVDRLSAQRSRDAVRTEFGVADEPWMLAVGSAGRCKGHDVLMRSLSRLPLDRPWHLTVVGGGDRTGEQAMVSDAGLDGRVSWAGARGDVPTLLHAADLLVHPSRWEGFGRVVAEALACGLPVVASDVGGVREVVADGEHGTLVPPEDAAALGRAIETTLTQPEETRRHADAGRARVLREFTARRSSRAIAAHLEAVASAPRETRLQESSA